MSTMMLATIIMMPRTWPSPRHTGRSLRVDRLAGPTDRCLDVEDTLGEDRAGEQHAEVDAEDRDDGHQRARSPCR